MLETKRLRIPELQFHENELNLETDITNEELEGALKSMKKGKAVGDDGLPIEIIAEEGEEEMQHLLRVIQIAYRTENVSEEWQKGVINPIYKKGEKTECENHQGITLLSHCGKLYSRIVERRLHRYIEPKLGE